MMKLMKNIATDYNELLIKPQITFIKNHPIFMIVAMISSGIYLHWIGKKFRVSKDFDFDTEFPDVTEEVAETLKKCADCDNQVTLDDIESGAWKDKVEGA